MTLENLLRIGRIKEHPVDATEIQKVLAAARRSLKDARVQEVSLELQMKDPMPDLSSPLSRIAAAGSPG